MINLTYEQNNLTKETSALISYINSPIFNLNYFSSEVTINVPNRIELYSSSDY
jgi:hypothetical protein